MSAGAAGQMQWMASAQKWGVGAIGAIDKSPTEFNQFLIEDLENRKKFIQGKMDIKEGLSSTPLSESYKKELVDAMTGLTQQISELTTFQKRMQGDTGTGIVPKIEVIKMPTGAPPTEPIEPGS
jgi:hypothetical protein